MRALTRRGPLLVLVATLALLGSAQAPNLPTGRWEISISGPASTGQSGEMRFDAAGLHVLLASHDSAFISASNLKVTDGHISFDVAPVGFHFDATQNDSVMRGRVSVDGMDLLDWQAWPIKPGLDRWPVRPRLVISQLMLGREGTSVEIPGSWVAAMPARASLGESYRLRAVAAGLPRPGANTVLAPDRMALGLDPDMRAVGRAVLEKIAASPAADAKFREIFGAPGQLRFDLHDRAVEAARQQHAEFSLAAAGRAIAALGGALSPDADSMAILNAAWGIWSQLGSDSGTVESAIRGLQLRDLTAGNSLKDLLTGYDLAQVWWNSAIRWLLTNPWLTTVDGRRSPAQLVAAFWGRDSVALPPLESVRFGGYEAYAVGGMGPLTDKLVRPGNAIAAEWLKLHGASAALLPWRAIHGQTDSLALQFGSRTVRLTSPWGWSSVHGGFLLPDHDVLRIDPGIAPYFALATVVHEWQHLIFTAGRFAGAGARITPTGLRLLDDDPWLNEGAAEWATSVILERGGTLALPLGALDAAKRYALEQGGGDDPHATGYRLVVAVASRGVTVSQLRERLVALMHDPAAFALASGLSGNRGVSPLRLDRPIDASVIPEISFTWDEGFADDMRRRLLVPPLPPEH